MPLDYDAVVQLPEKLGQLVQHSACFRAQVGAGPLKKDVIGQFHHYPAILHFYLHRALQACFLQKICNLVQDRFYFLHALEQVGLHQSVVFADEVLLEGLLGGRRAVQDPGMTQKRELDGG